MITGTDMQTYERAAEIREKLGALEIRVAVGVRQIRAENTACREVLRQYIAARRAARMHMGVAREHQRLAMASARKLAFCRHELGQLEKGLDYRDDPTAADLRRQVRELQQLLAQWAEQPDHSDA